jgi:oxygen-independent coproporphyrinogen-3 oxidase
MRQLSVYVHVPFCRSKCRYCAFNSYAGLAHLHEPYVEALRTEIAAAGRQQGHPQVATVYIGGGTPTTLATGLLGGILQACGEHFVLLEDGEITVEANPGTLTPSCLLMLRQLGVTRLSLGVQSFSDDMLALMGRVHSGGEAREAFYLARQAGFNNINLDLIYSLPTQTFGQWGVDLSGALALQPEHLSLYCLSVEEGTPLARMLAVGALPTPDADVGAGLYSLAEERLDQAGYSHYELSNWAKPGYECRHNLAYWRNASYLGFGAGAHSFHEGRRWHNVAAPEEYVGLLHAGESPIAGSEEIGIGLEMTETMIMGLRLCEGVSFRDFEERFRRSLVTVFGDEMKRLVGQGLLDVNGNGLRLTQQGRLLGNEVFEAFLPPENSSLG